MLVVDHEPLSTCVLVSAEVLLQAPVTAPATAHTALARSPSRQLLNQTAVIEGELRLCHSHIEKSQRESEHHIVISVSDGRQTVRVWGRTHHSSVGENGRRRGVMEETGVSLFLAETGEAFY